ncbi:MAG: lytic transglycosylase domain-containing protein [Deltaproteobacteria bacterium]|nr:lytic transglycosylase domain-containing protein [Deltaproteobacteria bacterium]
MVKMRIYGGIKFSRKVVFFRFIMVFLDLSFISPRAVTSGEAGPDYPWNMDGEMGRVFVLLNGHRTGLSLPERVRLSYVIVEEGRRYDFDPLFILALIETESTFYNWSRSNKGAMGLMQVLPGTGRMVAGELNIPWDGDETLFNPFHNVRIGLRYFSTLLGMYKDDLDKALAAYSSGPSYIEALAADGEGLPTRFSERVFSHYNDLRERIKT